MKRNIYEALSSDHREFEKQLDDLLAASKAGDARWKTILDDLRRGVIAHAHAEEAVFYNALRETEAGKGLILHSYGEHATSETELRTLGVAKLIDANWTSLMEKFAHDLRHHIKEEESRLYGAARSVFSEAEAQQLAEAFERMKLETAKDGDSLLASQIDLIVNLLPPRLTDSFRKSIKTLRKAG